MNTQSTQKLASWTGTMALLGMACCTQAALLVSDSFEDGTVGTAPGTSLQKGAAVSTASYAVTTNTTTGSQIQIKSGSATNGTGANQQTLKFYQSTSSPTVGNNTSLYLNFAPALSASDVALGNSVTFSFNIKFNSWPSSVTSTPVEKFGFTLYDSTNAKTLTQVYFRSDDNLNNSYIVSGQQALGGLSSPAKPSKNMEVGKWYNFTQVVDLHAKTFYTTMTIYNEDGTVSSTQSNSTNQNFTSTGIPANPSFNRVAFLTERANIVDAEINDLSITYTPVPEPTVISMLGLGGSLLVLRRNRKA